MRKGQLRYSRGYRPRSFPRTWVLFLVLVLSYVLFFSPIFEIKEIKISGNRVIGNEEIRNSLAEKNNIFLVTKSRLRKVLAENFPRISSLEKLLNAKK